MLVDGSVTVYHEGRGLITRQNFFYSFLIFIPTGIFQGRDIKESVPAWRVELCHIGGVESGPAIPNFLQVGFVWNGSGGLRCGLFRGSKSCAIQGDRANQDR